MYAHVQLLQGYHKILTYHIPAELNNAVYPGSIVLVPLQKRQELALVIDIAPALTPEERTFTVRAIISIASAVKDRSYVPFLIRTAQIYAITPSLILRKIQNLLRTKELEAVPPVIETNTANTSHYQLSEEQQNAVTAIETALAKKIYTPILVHGVTGAGKTAVYLAVMERILADNKQVLFLVPEIGLALHMANLFTKYFTQQGRTVPIHQLHAAASAEKRATAWSFVTSPIAGILIGIHLPALLPNPHLGLIIVDEEHETSYQEQRHPRIHSREIAHVKAQTYQLPIIFGSATPSIQTLHTAQERKWLIVNLKKRFSGTAAPTIEQINLLEDRKRPYFWISSRLQYEIQQRLERKEQSLVFLNRRGYSFFIQCQTCGHIFQCPHCSVSLTFHKDAGLECHYCGYKKAEPSLCSACNGKKLLKKGIGTQQIVQILQELFPNARIERADLDTTKNKKLWTFTAEKIKNGTVDIIVGTQTITKGYHFPKVTLVGVIWADIALSIPQYNACETALQQLIQVAGRAGRELNNSLVIVQYCTKHAIFSYLHEDQYLDFVTYEGNFRKLLKYPPYTKLAEIVLQSVDEQLVEKEILIIKKQLQIIDNTLQILGPAKPVIHKKEDRFFRTLLIKSTTYSSISNTLNQLQTYPIKSTLTWTIQPV